MDKGIYQAFKALGEPTRLKIIKMLSYQAMCVCELSEVLDMLQPRVSQHLKILKDAELVAENKEGNFVCYTLNRDQLDQLWHDFNFFLNAEVSRLPGYEKESDRLNNLSCNEKVKEIKEKLKSESR
ncbi:ArsR/SmtB family transcription factor [Dehalobacterium formicoaceticum]|uniref:ArsR/SmtB family transcription factor n=1 Tax=Dehalobacterium formicoaceticum TaxID=51515 RepID=UPI000B7E1246|nr:metalloregulator ArsR/SmtB family transcription factor [Dehalobacterium formicoaceticum]